MLYLPSEQGLSGQPDADHLATATSLGAVLVTQNQQDFVPLHHQWESEERRHAGILLVTGGMTLGAKIAWLECAARLLTSEAAQHQLMKLDLFRTEESAERYVRSLAPLMP